MSSDTSPTSCSRASVHDLRSSALSGGERNRLLLARLFAQPANVLVLDEPTNDLDIETLELLEELIAGFDGTVLLVTHDREFLDNVITSTFAFEGDGRIVEYVGGWEDYLRQAAPALASALPGRPARAASERHGQSARPERSERRKKTFREEREYAALPGVIEALEAEQRTLQQEAASPEFYKSRAITFAWCWRVSTPSMASSKMRCPDGSSWRGSDDDRVAAAGCDSRSACGSEEPYSRSTFGPESRSVFISSCSALRAAPSCTATSSIAGSDTSAEVRSGGGAIVDGAAAGSGANAHIQAMTVTRVGDQITRRNPVIEIWVERNGAKKERLFNPYTGEDLGDAITKGELGVMWMARLHDELLFDRPGKYANGAGSIVFTLLVVTGAIVWWPGVTRWRRSLRDQSPRRMEAHQLGHAQRDGVLAVPVHAGVGDLGNLFGHTGAICEFRRRHLRIPKPTMASVRATSSCCGCRGCISVAGAMGLSRRSGPSSASCRRSCSSQA